eukprot:1726085-Prymnesium_polylepis.2
MRRAASGSRPPAAPRVPKHAGPRAMRWQATLQHAARRCAHRAGTERGQQTCRRSPSATRASWRARTGAAPCTSSRRVCCPHHPPVERPSAAQKAQASEQT